MVDIFQKAQSESVRTLCSADIRALARVRLPRFVFDYVEGGAEDEACLRRSEQHLAALQILPMCLRDTTKIDLSVEVFGDQLCAIAGGRGTHPHVTKGTAERRWALLQDRE
jgi:isopentenyl diphosphate isomerase/L-lactate dehydrogenase-like FMN-dependent dehydrogenase